MTTPHPDQYRLMLDIASDVGGLVSDVKHIRERLETIEPVVWNLETERVKKIGLSEGVTRYAKVAHTIWASGLGAAVVLAWSYISPFLPRV